MTNVVVVVEGYASGVAGAELMAWGTARKLAARGHGVVVLAAPANGPSPGDPLAVLDWRRVADGADCLPWTPDVVHAFDLGRPEPLPFAAKLVAECGAWFAVTPATTADLWPDHAAAVATLAAADAVLALTPTEATLLARHVRDLRRVSVVGQATDLPVARDPMGLRERLGMTGPVVLFLGRRLPSKGVRELLAAMTLVRAVAPDVRLVLAGPGEPVTRPDVLDLGLVDQAVKADLIAACDVLCLPSRADVFPLVFLEAWALRRPVVCGDFAGAQDVVRHEVDGLVTAVTPEAVAAALLRLLDDAALRERMGAAGADRIEQELNWSVLIDAVIRCYEGGAVRS